MLAGKIKSPYIYHMRKPFFFSLFGGLLLVLWCTIGYKGRAQDPVLSHDPDSSLRLYPPWMLWVPGATHFADGNWENGLAFSLGETGAIALGIAFDKQLRSESSSPYYNYPLLLGFELYNIDKCHFMRNRLEYLRTKYPGFRYDDISFNKLMLEPFRPKNVFTPITGLFVAVALGQLYLESRSDHPGYSDVNELYLLNRYVPRNRAMAFYGTASLAASWGAGLGEEYWFRNGLMPIWDYRFGQQKGLAYSSLLFGSLHLTNILFEREPDLKAALTQALAATVAGWLLGRDVQKRDYDIGPASAAHTWYDFTLMLGSFLINPEDNIFGVGVRFVLP